MPDWLPGLWHLVDEGADEQNIPQHRVDIRLYSEAGQLRAAGINRNNGQESLYAAATFDGLTLRLKRTPSSNVWLVMHWNGRRFDGDWRDDANQPPGPQIKLKLIRGQGQAPVPGSRGPVPGAVPGSRFQGPAWP
jgi:hypothetical protein